MRQVINGVVGELDSLPGCTQVAVSHAVFVPASQRGQGKGKAANERRLRNAYDLGYDYIMCTSDAANVAQNQLLVANGWKSFDRFVSRKTGHTVLLWGKILENPE